KFRFRFRMVLVERLVSAAGTGILARLGPLASAARVCVKLTYGLRDDPSYLIEAIPTPECLPLIHRQRPETCEPVRFRTEDRWRIRGIHLGDDVSSATILRKIGVLPRVNCLS